MLELSHSKLLIDLGIANLQKPPPTPSLSGVILPLASFGPTLCVIPCTTCIYPFFLIQHSVITLNSSLVSVWAKHVYVFSPPRDETPADF